MDTAKIKERILKINQLKERAKKINSEIDELTNSIEEEMKEYLDATCEASYTDNNVHFEQETKISKSIDSRKVIMEHSDIIADAMKAGAMSVTLNLSKTIKVLKDNGVDAEQYINLGTNTKLSYSVSDDDEEEEMF